MATLSVAEEINRGNNLLAVAIVGLSGFAFSPEIFVEDKWLDKSDDFILLAVGIVAIVWYRMGRNRFSRSIVPVLLVSASLLAKIAGLVLEFSDVEDRGDDIGALILFVLATALVSWEYVKSSEIND